MIFESDGLALCKIKGSVVPQALLLTLPSLLLTVALYVVNQEVEGGLQSIRIGDVSVTQAGRLDAAGLETWNAQPQGPHKTLAGWVGQRSLLPHAREAWSAMTLLLGMLTGFRTQQSLDRYWEGRASKIPRSSGPLMEKVIGWAKGLTHCHKLSSGPISRMKTMQLSKAKLGKFGGHVT